MKKKAFWIITIIAICIASTMPFSLLAEEDSNYSDGFDYFNYYRLEYLQNNESNIYNFNVPFSWDSEVKGSFKADFSTTGSAAIFSNGSNNYRLGILGYNDYVRLYLAAGSSGSVINKLPVREHTFSLSGEAFKIDNWSIIPGTSQYNENYFTDKLYVFQRNSANMFYGKFYYLDIQNDEYHYNFIPAKRISDLKIGLYDTINKQFYPLNGFIGGPSISPNVIYGINRTNYLTDLNSSTVIESHTDWIDLPEIELYTQYSPTGNTNHTDYQVSLNGSTSGFQLEPTINYIVQDTQQFTYNQDTEVVFDNHYYGWIEYSITDFTTGTSNLVRKNFNGTSVIIHYENSIYKSYLYYGNSLLTVYNLAIGDFNKAYNSIPSIGVTITDIRAFPVNTYVNDQQSNELIQSGTPESSVSVGSASQSNDQFNQTTSQFDSLESGQLDQVQSDLNGINTTFALGTNSKFLRSANFVKQQFDTNFSNNEFGSVLLFSLTVGLVMLLIGKVLK